MIDWDKAPEGATHGVMDGKVMMGWTRAAEGFTTQIYQSVSKTWHRVSPFTLAGYRLEPRPAPRTETDDLLDMIREQKRKAFEMGYNQAVADINQQEKQS